MGEAGIFLTRCWLHTDRDVSKTFNHARVPSWFLTHTLLPALGDAIAGDRVDLRGPLPCCQCRDQAARQGQEAMKQNLLLETEPHHGEPQVTRCDQPLCKQFLGQPAPWVEASLMCGQGVPLPVLPGAGREMQGQWRGTLPPSCFVPDLRFLHQTSAKKPSFKVSEAKKRLPTSALNNQWRKNRPYHPSWDPIVRPV